MIPHLGKASLGSDLKAQDLFIGKACGKLTLVTPEVGAVKSLSQGKAEK